MMRSRTLTLLFISNGQLGRRSDSNPEHRSILRSGGGRHLDGEVGSVPGGDRGRSGRVAVVGQTVDTAGTMTLKDINYK